MDLPIDYATLRGHCDSNAIHRFAGIPYAQDPVGELRWRAPLPVDRNLGLIDATGFGAVPAQPVQPHQRRLAQRLFFSPIEPQSEACLTLNVWTPTLDRGARLPVMMWIPGGGFRGGSAASPLYDGTALAARGVVVVSINYRVSRLGFLAHPWLSDESPHGTSGNYGLLDQIAALDWIRDRIELFGGDAANVTIFGQSAGSQSVSFLILSPLAKGLFHRAIAQSGSPFASPVRPGLIGRKILSRDEAEAEGLQITEKLGVSTLRDLRSLSAQRIHDACPPDSFAASRPILDGHVLPMSPAQAYDTGCFNDVPLICGTTRDEGSIFAGQMDAAAHRAFCAQSLPDDVEAYRALYPFDEDATSIRSSTRAYGDRMYRWPVVAWARRHAERTRHAVHLYRFKRCPPAAPADAADCPAGLGAFHGSDLPYTFGNFYPAEWSWSADDRHASDVMSTIWTHFAMTGSPNGQGLPEWPAYDAQSARLMLFDASGAHVVDDRSSRLAFWQRLAHANGD